MCSMQREGIGKAGAETGTEKPAFSAAPASAPENQDNEILRLFESGMSLSQIGARFGISKSSAHAAKERAKKAQAQPA